MLERRFQERSHKAEIKFEDASILTFYGARMMFQKLVVWCAVTQGPDDCIEELARRSWAEESVRC